jgi:tetratricopeptide (TPR) repeat protein
VTWLEPIDVDDSEFWLMANLERKIAERLNPDGDYFQEYLTRISEMPRYERAYFGHETVLAHLRRASEVFCRCYDQYTTQQRQVLVITLDTVEAIRGTDMVLNAIQWMRRLPSTLFILAGRPVSDERWLDPIVEQFKGERHKPLPYGIAQLAGFSYEEALAYLDEGKLAYALSAEEKAKIVLLTQGHPLWLALAVDYLDKAKMPEATATSLDDLNILLRYRAEQLPERGQRLHEEFVRSLIIPYRESDFWHESIKRLAVARRRMNRTMWETLMADRRKEVADWDTAWDELLRLPWIRPRANSQYITLHDALAEELGHRIIPLQGENWYRRQWESMVRIYADLIAHQEPAIEQGLASFERYLQEKQLPEEAQQTLIERVSKLDARVRELDDLKATHFYYQTLLDCESGLLLFVSRFDEATRKHEFRLRELLWSEMQRFLPGEMSFAPLSDIVLPTVERFRAWLTSQPSAQYEIGWRGAAHLVDSGRAAEADARLNALLSQFSGDLEKEYRLFNLRGNARMKILGKVQEAEADFQEALKCTQRADASDALKRLQGQAHKEVGFYYRNIGRMNEAAQSYQEALQKVPLSEGKERASIQTNLAYALALSGENQYSLGLVETALHVRRRLGLRREVGMSLSVKGEIYRYSRDFEKAWEAYQEAAAIFEQSHDWPWLGLIYQEQAICLFQAISRSQRIGSYKDLPEMQRHARELSLQALTICRDMNIRGYPSALNRAARIVGGEHQDQGIAYLKEGIESAEALADGWFLYANIVELAELCYRAWQQTNDTSYRDQILVLSGRVDQVKRDYQFSDLRGRWDLLQGHLAVHQALVTIDSAQKDALLDQALEHYKRGFPQEVGNFWGSHGGTAIRDEFERFGQLLGQLPLLTREKWCEELRLAWSELTHGYLEDVRQSGPLQSYLTDIYTEYVSFAA